MRRFEITYEKPVMGKWEHIKTFYSIHNAILKIDGDQQFDSNAEYIIALQITEERDLFHVYKFVE